MDILWPGSLLLLGVIPLLVAAYIWMLRRRKRFTVRFSSLSLVYAARPRHSWLRRHLPFALFALALTSLVVALARPVAIVSVPAGQTTIVLAIDVSRSMCSTDIAPSRLEAAQAAALSFIARQRATTQISIVAFAGFAEIVQAPTTDQDALTAAVTSLTTGRRTAIGSGILTAINAIAEIDKNVAPSVTEAAPGSAPAPVPRGAYAPEIIVLLTDGVSNAGPQPLEAAQQALERGVRVYTIGFGTERGSLPVCAPQLQGGGSLDSSQGGGRDPQFGGGGGGGGGGFRRGIDEAALRQVAELTGGEYYAAESAGELQGVFENLPTYLITKHEIMEITVAFAALGALLAALAVLLSLRWHPLL
ncbi:MAG: VWA domain-containing protein [Kouleothrix sp.]|jgi:Ca-activated chloride channel family protein|nr:VWA domain-containing protein [Kouleothrix sp.]